MSKLRKMAVFAGITGTTIANGAVYIAPADIDTYKQKTDQSFYDMYQNPNSPIAKGANPTLKGLVNNVKTGNKIAVGNTIGKIIQGSVQGAPIKIGTTARGYIKGIGTLTFQVDGQGNVKLYGPYTTSDHTKALREGDKAIPVSTRCVKKKSYPFGKVTRTACVLYERQAIEEKFDVTSGTFTQRKVIQRATQTCQTHRTGKYQGYITCKKQPYDTTQVLNIKTQSVNIADTLKGKQKLALTIDKKRIDFNGDFTDKIDRRSNIYHKGGKHNNYQNYLP